MPIRKMEIADIPAVLALQNELKFQDWNEKQFASEIRAGYAYCVVFTPDQATPIESVSVESTPAERASILGYAVFHLMGPDSELLSIAVHPRVQRSGIGESLLYAGVSQLDLASSKEGPSKDCCFLEVRETNEKARRFYEKHSFKLFGIRKKYYSDGENAALYKLECAPTRKV